MNIILSVQQKKITISLRKGKEIVDQKQWGDKRDLSLRLLSEIDALLQKNDVLPSDIKKMFVTTDLPEGYTTPRIAETVAKTWNFAVQSFRK